MNSQPANLPRGRASVESGKMFVVSGRISCLYVTDGTVNLLEGLQGTMLATGMGAVVGGMPGSAANAAMISMYEGESVRHFGCYIGNRLVIGTFQSIDFADGDEVKAVVTRLDEDACFSHAVVRPVDGLVWMPYAVSKGRWKVAQWMAIACLAESMAPVSLHGHIQPVPFFQERIFPGILSFDPARTIDILSGPGWRCLLVEPERREICGRNIDGVGVQAPASGQLVSLLPGALEERILLHGL